VIVVEIDESVLYPYLIYNDPVKYSENITLHPVKMDNIFLFQQCVSSITVRKNSIFPVKNILKMSYLEFLFYCHDNIKLATNYKLPFLTYWYRWAFELLKLVCKDQEVLAGNEYGVFQINGELITPEKFDDIRRIIIIQNDVDFDIDEFINYDTEQELLKAQNVLGNQNKEKATIEDYIDSLAIDLKVTDDYIKSLTIRKFWRYIKRINMHEDYTICRTGALSGMVTFKDPSRHWMVSIEKKDKFSDVKTSEDDIKSKVG
jgi:hypothetical protein